MPKSKKQKSSIKKRISEESDSTFFLKLVTYVMLGSLWVKFADPIQVGSFIFNGIPFGLLLGVLFVSHDHFQVDRKIGYSILVLMTVLTYFLPAGIVI